jgi:hypothetical protein
MPIAECALGPALVANTLRCRYLPGHRPTEPSLESTLAARGGTGSAVAGIRVAMDCPGNGPSAPKQIAMKRLGLAVLLAAALASPAMAGQVRVGYEGSNYGPYQTGVGGEFTLTPLTAWLDTSLYGAGARNFGVTGSFQTFCIEGTEYIYPYPATYNGELTTYAIKGGAGAVSGKDPVSVGTGWLYSQFASTNWVSGLSYGYGSNRATSADALQRTFWWLEGGEEGVVFDSNNIYMAAVVKKFVTPEAAMADGAANYGVYALNIWTDSGGDAQTQLFYVPDGGVSLMLLGGALVGLGTLRRKLRA